MFGTGLGPMCSGFIAQSLSWRWVFYVQVMTCGFLIFCVIIFFKETRGSVLLSRKAQALNEWYQKREEAGYIGFELPQDYRGNIASHRLRWKVKSDEERETLAKMISISVRRPFCGFLSVFKLNLPNGDRFAHNRACRLLLLTLDNFCLGSAVSYVLVNPYYFWHTI